MPDRIDRIRVKVDRAKKHIIELQTEVGAFVNSDPYVIKAKRDPDTRKPTEC